MVRINKYLAQCNLGSRRSVEKLVLDGKISINGKVETNLSLQINPNVDIIKHEGKLIIPKSENIYLMLNKPKKYLVSKKDDFDRRLIYDLLPDFGTNLFYIGRLDYMSEGLLLLTNDGDFAEKIIHPKYKLQKLYKVKIKGNITSDSIDKLRKGIILNGKKTKPAIVYVNNVKNNITTLKITIFEGRKRQIRYMLKSVGSEVLELKRLQIGNVKLNKLPLGMWRMLKPSEVTSLLYTSKTNTKRK
ncbi:MAG: pseudouridine synthase [Candidatus Tenebribacter burtonii]|jgi:23S rRNA pseudouridine2605 synthase|nr:pseudouridine synthase [Candidatus Tenebribacter burtonii]